MSDLVAQPIITVAHTQQVTNRYQLVFPDHAPRATDPHYKAFNAYRRLHVAQAVCYVGQRVGFDQCADALGKSILTQPGDAGHGLELHHHVIEFSLLNSVDLKALEVDFPFLTDSAAIDAWAEGANNLQWLCLTPDAPVLMADGATRRIEDVSVGDWVIGGGGTPDLVTDARRKRYSGDVLYVGPTTLTASHRVATDHGWVSIGQVAEEIRVLGSDVVRLRCVQDEVGWSVIRPVPVDVVDALLPSELATENALSDDAMLQTGARSHVALAGQGGRHSSNVPLWEFVQAAQPTGVRAVTANPLSPMASGREQLAAPLAGERRTMGWLTVNEPVRASYSGFVHDLSIAQSHSFVSGGIVVHNCAKHHRGQGGIHHAAFADFEAGLYIRGLFG